MPARSATQAVTPFDGVPGSPASTRSPRRRADPETELARLDPRWIGYAPATLSGVVTAAVLIGFGWRIINEAQLDPARFSVVHQALRYLQGTPVWVDILQGSARGADRRDAAVGGRICVVVLGLSAHPASARHAAVSRGLLTTRSTSIEERRLRGVDRSEPLLLRRSAGLGCRRSPPACVIAGAERGSALLVPPAPLRTVVEVEAACSVPPRSATPA